MTKTAYEIMQTRVKLIGVLDNWDLERSLFRIQIAWQGDPQLEMLQMWIHILKCIVDFWIAETANLMTQYSPFQMTFVTYQNKNSSPCADFV